MADELIGSVDLKKIKIAEMKTSSFSRSPVDIIIPFYGQYEKVSKLISSIINAVKSNPYQITVVDDASPNSDFVNEFKDFDKKRPYGTESILKLVRSETRLGFGGALQLGMRNTNQPWVLFLHSDCVVEDPNWMVEMGRSLLKLKDKGVRMVSSRTNDAFFGCSKVIAGKKEDKINDFILEDGFLPMFSVMCHRELFSKVGGFIKNYFPAGYEDEEFAFRMNHYGFKQAICGKSWIYHEGGGTLNHLMKNPTMGNAMDLNRDKCIADMQRFLKK
jgi:GT2 family glycosyltransferase